MRGGGYLIGSLRGDAGRVFEWQFQRGGKDMMIFGWQFKRGGGRGRIFGWELKRGGKDMMIFVWQFRGDGGTIFEWQFKGGGVRGGGNLMMFWVAVQGRDGDEYLRGSLRGGGGGYLSGSLSGEGRI